MNHKFDWLPQQVFETSLSQATISSSKLIHNFPILFHRQKYLLKNRDQSFHQKISSKMLLELKELLSINWVNRHLPRLVNGHFLGLSLISDSITFGVQIIYFWRLFGGYYIVQKCVQSAICSNVPNIQKHWKTSILKIGHGWNIQNIWTSWYTHLENRP